MMEMGEWDTIVIGGGQAGLAVGYYLRQMNRNFIILDAQERTGDAWRKRWDSLRLFTPAWLNALPGMPFPGPADHFPTKDEVASYLFAYQQKFDLPVRHNCKVARLSRLSGKFEVVTGEGSLFAGNVIVATGSYQQPKKPEFAGQFNQDIEQLHSSTYTDPRALPAGNILVVGAGTSGLQIALDVKSEQREREVFLSGRPTAHIPDLVFRYFERPFVWFAMNILTVKTPMGRKVSKAIRVQGKGAPLINVSMKDIKRAGIRHVPRITGERNGWPVTEKGDRLGVGSIIWATGFAPDYSWISIPGCLDEQGYPLAQRGISTGTEGLYFVGSMFQYGLTSTWLGGVGRDARFVCQHLSARQTV